MDVCSLSCCQNISSSWYHQDLEGPYLASQSFSLWINSDGICGLGCDLQWEGAEGREILACASHATASALGPVPHVWERWAVGLLRNWAFLNLPVWAGLRGKCMSDVQGLGALSMLSYSLWHKILHYTLAMLWPCSEPSVARNLGKKLHQHSYTSFKV